MLAPFPDVLTKIHSRELSLPALSGLGAEEWGWPLPILQLLLRLSLVSGLRMPEQLPDICQTQRFLLFVWRNGLHSLKGKNPFAGIHVVSRNTRIWALQTGTKNKDVKFPVLVFFLRYYSRKKTHCDKWTVEIRSVITPGCSITKTCLGR